MKKSTKIWLIIATLLVAIGLIMFAAVMEKYNWDFVKLNTGNFETNTYKISKEFSNISMNTNTANITFIFSDSKKCKVECYEEEKSKHSVTVEEDTLVIKVIDNKSWYDNIGINFSSPKVTIYLPKTEYTSLFINEDTGDIEIPKAFTFKDIDISSSTGDIDCTSSALERIKIKTSTGNICLENATAEELELSASTGKITVSNVICAGDTNIKVSTGKTNLTDIKCKNLISNGSTGDISLKNVIATEKFTINRSTGDINFDGCDSAEIFIKTDTGDVVGSLLTDKVFITNTDTGIIDVPKTIDGGRCEIITSTGNIYITVD